MAKLQPSIEFKAGDYWENRLSTTYDLEGVGYIGMGKQYNKWLYWVRKQSFLRRMKKFKINFAEKDIFDIGSGTGFYIELWNTLGVKSVTGSDITQTAVRRLRQKYPTNTFYELDIGKKSISEINQIFDIVSAFDVLYHIVDDEQYSNAIHNIHNMLRPGGLLIFSDNFLHSNTKRGRHQVSRSYRDIKVILSKAGFDTVERFPQFYLMNTPVDSKSLIFKGSWRAIQSFIKLGEWAGFIAGATLAPVELLLTSIMSESPSSEIMICRKPER